MQAIDAALARKLLPKRDPNGHKGTFGKIYVYGGCVGYTGAPAYAGEAAVRSGGGLVYVGVPREVYPVVAGRCASAMVQPVPEDRDELLSRMGKCGVIVIGPGLGRERTVQDTVLFLLRELKQPVVLDADGINAVSAHIDVLKGRCGPTVVTPHEGEFLRLGGALETGRMRSASDLARRLGCVVALKGPGTVVAHPDGRVRVNTTGNCGMAKGGSGDVLSGMIAALAAQGADCFDAAACAVWLHGRSGDLCEQSLTAYAMTPWDLIERLPDAFRELAQFRG